MSIHFVFEYSAQLKINQHICLFVLIACDDFLEKNISDAHAACGETGKFFVVFQISYKQIVFDKL